MFLINEFVKIYFIVYNICKNEVIYMKNRENILRQIKEKNYLLASKYILAYLDGQAIPDDLSFQISEKIYCFKENFLKFVGKNPFNADIKDYKKDVIDYMNNAYPYCLEFGGNIENFSNLDDALIYYAKSRGASEEQLEQIIPMLKGIKMPVTETKEYHYDFSDSDKELVSLDQIGCSLHSKYRGESLYDTIVAVNDKNISNFINYLVVNNVFNASYVERTMNGIACYKDNDNNLFVLEGNHRVITLKALKAIREYVEGNYIPSPMFNADVAIEKKYNFNC